MPELPEVETTKRALQPWICGAQLQTLEIHQSRLRWPVPMYRDFPLKQTLHSLQRRGKYLIFYFPQTAILMHLGMSGSLRIVQDTEPRKKHDHLTFIFSRINESSTQLIMLRYHDPRRFGCVLLTQDPVSHPLIKNLGVEPLSNQFSPSFLQQHITQRATSIKSILMQANFVTGIGNIYANEALFLARVRPDRPAKTISQKEAACITAAVKTVLTRAITQGGTTLRDFVSGNNHPGYFQQQLHVYGRAGSACRICQHPVQSEKQQGRSSFWCGKCQQ